MDSVEPADETEFLPRAKAQIDAVEFKKLFDLNRDCEWLESEYEALIELWNLCEFDGQTELIADLLRRFEIVDSYKLNEYGKKVAEKIAVEWGLNPNKTRIVAVSDNSEADGSQFFLQSLKSKFAEYGGWSESCFINDIRIARDKVKRSWTYVLLDDFIGTGKTIDRKVRWFLAELEKAGTMDAIVKVVAIGGMSQSQKTLDELGVDYYCPVWLEKGISDHYESGELSMAIDSMKELETKLGKHYRGWWLSTHKFGFGKSEALFCVHPFNAPNNVFPVFWWPVLRNSVQRKTVLSRLR